MGMRGSGALIVEDEVEGIELTVGVFPQKEPEGFVEPPTVPSDAQLNEAGELQGPPPDDMSDKGQMGEGQVGEGQVGEGQMGSQPNSKNIPSQQNGINNPQDASGQMGGNQPPIDE